MSTEELSMEVRTAIEAIHPGACYGNWADSAPECKICFIQEQCKVKSKAKNSEKKVASSEPVQTEVSETEIPPAPKKRGRPRKVIVPSSISTDVSESSKTPRNTQEPIKKPAEMMKKTEASKTQEAIEELNNGGGETFETAEEVIADASSEEEIPESFEKALEDLETGQVVEMETALTEEPPAEPASITASEEAPKRRGRGRPKKTDFNGNLIKSLKGRLGDPEVVNGNKSIQYKFEGLIINILKETGKMKITPEGKEPIVQEMMTSNIGAKQFARKVLDSM